MSSSADVLCDAKIGAAAARLQVSRGQTADRASIPTVSSCFSRAQVLDPPRAGESDLPTLPHCWGPSGRGACHVDWHVDPLLRSRGARQWRRQSQRHGDRAKEGGGRTPQTPDWVDIHQGDAWDSLGDLGSPVGGVLIALLADFLLLSCASTCPCPWSAQRLST
jgi:hypothetical protein